MQKRAIFFLCGTFFSLSLLAQQSIQLEYGTSGLTQKRSGSLSLAWYRNDALKSGHVMRMNYDKSVSDNIQEVRSRSLQFDVAKRWHSPLDKKLRLYLESGISGMVINSENQWDRSGAPFSSTDNGCVFCLTIADRLFISESLFTKENSLLLYDRKGQEYALNIMPGATLGGGMDISLTSSFYMGLHYRINTYYWIGENEWLFYLRYGLNAGFLF